MEGNFNRDILNAGDPAAALCVELFDKYYRLLLFFAFRIVKDRTVAEDIIQETFLRIYEKPIDIVNPQALKSYLFTAVRNRCFDWLKHQRTQQQYQHKYQPQPPEEYILAAMVEGEALEILAQHIDKLPAECRRIMSMVMQGFSSVEIAQKLDLAPSTVRAQKARGVKLLREMLPKELFVLFLAIFSDLI